ncbi:MAG: hypothetical protein AAFV53_36180 [Myxococcota bacterium]
MTTIWIWMLSTAWATDLPAPQLADRSYAETWMVAEGVSEEHTSLLSGVSRSWGRGLRWSQWDGRALAASETAMEAEQTCTQLLGRDPVPGPREVAVYYSRGPDQPRDAQVLLVSGDRQEQALVSLRPGEQILTVHREDLNSGERAEFLEVRSQRGRLSLTRSGRGSVSCYEPVR